MKTNYILSEREKNTLADFAGRIEFTDDISTHDELVALSANLVIENDKTLAELRTLISSTIKTKKCKTVLVIENLPVVKHPYILSLLLGRLCGQVRKEYRDGVWFKIIKSNSTIDQLFSAPSSKDSKDFPLHTDLSYTQQPPGFFLLHCIENHPSMGGDTTLCMIDDITAHLTEKSYLELSKPNFIFSAPSYYEQSGQQVKSVISTENDNLTIRYRRDGIMAVTRDSMEALAELTHIISKYKTRLSLKTNSTIVFNNLRVLHGRHAFVERDTHHQRHYCQIYFE